MTLRFIVSAVFAVALCGAACAQDANPAPPDNQDPAGGAYGQPGGRGGMGMGNGAMMGRGVQGTVTEAAADHFTVKTFSGETYTVHFSANTRFRKQPAGQRGGGAWRPNGGGRGQGMGGGNPPEPIKSSDIKVGDAIAAMGEMDEDAKSVGALGVVLLDPERAKAMRQMEADYGKTWLMGKVTAIDGAQVTLMGALDHAPHTFVADENTTFRERRNPITLPDIKVGDMLRAEGAVKDGTFTASTVNVMRPQNEMPRVPRQGPAQPQQPAQPQ